MANRHWLQNLGVTQFIKEQGFIYVDSDLAIELITNDIGSDTLTCAILTGGHVSGGSTSPSALLELQSTQGAMLLSRMSTTERNALSGATNGMIIYNTTTNQFEFYQNGNWVSYLRAPIVSFYSAVGTYTWTPNPSTTEFRIQAIGGGGGGYLNIIPKEVYIGGAGGGYGDTGILPISQITSSAQVIVGKGGIGARPGSPHDATPATNGDNSSVISGSYSFVVKGGLAGRQIPDIATTYVPTDGTPASNVDFIGGGGAIGVPADKPTNLFTGQSVSHGGGGGGASGYYDDTGSTSLITGGSGGNSGNFSGGSFGTTASPNGHVGQGWNEQMGAIVLGGAGGGGALASNPQTPGVGGDGGLFGGGGGGGYAANVSNKLYVGKGGNGGHGCVLITEY